MGYIPLPNSDRSGGESSGWGREHCDEFVDGDSEGSGRIVERLTRRRQCGL
jgi:hypothetical protein